MLTATFKDGTAVHFEVVQGDRFEPREGEKVLFEFPDGALKEGMVCLRPTEDPGWQDSPRRGIYDRKAKTVAIET